MGDKPLDAEYIRNLLAGKKKIEPVDDPTVVTVPKLQSRRETVFATDARPDPLKRPRCGEQQDGDRGDIWTQWIKQGRLGARELIERWG